ncbi:uncharacterized protein K02A2.6-like [Wyeomyia smithii]|uniref:uncharacterized protein K02A2.6-like n=1 Tax=Wyeomyia smithii TaxID=174621 RepID=UPI002467DF26|nr:uncharacterized protein K02A2.6-like [Wyeomyia smithii]
MTDTTAEHEHFSSMHQGKSDSVMAFHARLIDKVRLCRYDPKDQERFVRAQLLKGMSNRELARTARTFGHVTTFIVQSATRDEAYQREITPAANGEDTTINQVRGRTSKAPLKREAEADQAGNSRSKQFRFNRDPPRGRRDRCSRCYCRAHWNRPCPALKLKCYSCGQMGHFSAVCRQKRINAVQERQTPRDDVVDSKIEELNALSLEDVLVECRVGSSSGIPFLIDSGAGVNVVGGNDWQRLREEYESGTVDLEFIGIGSGRGLRAYATHVPMVVDSAFRANIQAARSTNSVVADFLVVKEGKRSLLGRSTASDLKLLAIRPQINEYRVDKKEIFPKMPGVKIRFSVDKTIPPTRNAFYNIPAAYREGARRRLLEMEANGIIERVISAPEWISGMSAVAKGKDDFRLVVNMRAPNRALKHEYFRLPLLDEMKVKLHGSKYFTKLDLKSAYYHLELCNESRDLTTFLAENGMFRFTRLMFRVNCAPEIFQREMTRTLEGVENKIVYLDDILVFANSLEELHKTVAQVLQIRRHNNLTLNDSKCEFDKTRITFLGHELDQNGFHIEESKIQAIKKFRRPSTTSELCSFLGLASYWTVAGSKTWSWGEQQERSFNMLKEQIIRCTVSLGYFSDRENTVLYTDASPSALGAVLVQESEGSSPRLISFASKALIPTEKKYAQNQREALGAVWAVEHFSDFLLGRHFTLRTDAKGVAFIFNRLRENTKRALTRADGWALWLSPYDYNIEYVKGQENIADSSSRLYQGNDNPFDEDTNSWEVAEKNKNRTCSCCIQNQSERIYCHEYT